MNGTSRIICRRALKPLIDAQIRRGVDPAHLIVALSELTVSVAVQNSEAPYAPLAEAAEFLLDAAKKTRQ